MTDLYTEILKMTPAELQQEEYYSIPLTLCQLTSVMNLLAENGESTLLEDIRIYLREEYDINYVPFYEKE
jgi:hypothetical protein